MTRLFALCLGCALLVFESRVDAVQAGGRCLHERCARAESKRMWWDGWLAQYDYDRAGRSTLPRLTPTGLAFGLVGLRRGFYCRSGQEPHHVDRHDPVHGLGGLESRMLHRVEHRGYFVFVGL